MYQRRQIYVHGERKTLRIRERPVRKHVHVTHITAIITVTKLVSLTSNVTKIVSDEILMNFRISLF